jgi:polar amino acid transport system ATP-binding protein
MSEVLRVENLHKRFGNLEVLKGINLLVEKGETVVILGASGSGKSTLLRCLNFLEIPSEGRIHLEGREVGSPRPGASGKPRIVYREAELAKLRAKVGMVFQQFNLFPHMTAEQNVMIAPMKIRRKSAAASRDLAAQNLEKVGLLDKAKEYPSRLSGGQQQRVAIARALAMEPAVMLFDEATSALDPELVGEVLLTIRRLSEEGMTMLVVTHELGFAYNVARHIVFLHDGLVHEEGPPHEVLRHPSKERTRDFLKGHLLFQLPNRPL